MENPNPHSILKHIYFQRPNTWV